MALAFTRVQVHDISGQLGLDRSQLPAPRGRAAGAFVHALGRLAPRPFGVGDGEIECWILSKDGFVQAAQLGSGLHADLVHEHLARGPKGRESVCLPAGPVERENSQSV